MTNARAQQNTELLEDWLYFLASKNAEVIAASSRYKDYLSSSQSVQLIFNICQKLNLPKEVKYCAVELFDRFLLKYAEEVHEVAHVWCTKPSWRDDLEDAYGAETFLRLASCVQIASKFYCHYKALNVARVCALMKEAFISFVPEQVLRSELIVLKALDFHVDILTPLTYMETLLEILAYNFPDIEPDKLYQVGIILLDWAYISRDRIYAILAEKAGQKGILDQCDLQSLRGDYLYLSVALIATAAILVCSDLYKHVVEQLHHMIQISIEDIDDFSHVIMESLTE